MYDSNRHKNLNSTSPMTRQEEDTETVNHHFWNCTHVRHPPDEQLRHSDISIAVIIGSLSPLEPSLQVSTDTLVPLQSEKTC